MQRSTIKPSSPLALLVIASALVVDAKRRNLGVAAFRDTVSGGLNTFQEGVVADQTRLLQVAVDGLGVYNENPDPIIDRMTRQEVRQTVKVTQAPKDFMKHADGSSGLITRNVKRLLNTPILDYTLRDQFTVLALMDMREDDIIAEVDTAIRGDADLMNALFWSAMFTKRTAGAVDTAYEPSFWNGETDVPAYRNNQFTAAHYHYKTSGGTTLTKAVFDDMIQDIQEHGHGLTPGSLECVVHSTHKDDVEAMVNQSSNILQAGTMNRERAIDSGFRGVKVMIAGVTIRVDDYCPPEYVGMYDTTEAILTRREPEDAQYQGLMLFREGGFSPEFPLAGSVFMRRVGMRPRLLGAATFRFLDAGGTYTNPTFRHPAVG